MHKYNNYLTWLAKVLFVTVVYGFLLIKLKNRFTDVSSLSLSDPSLFIPVLVIMIGLWAGNLSLEALKWKTLLQGHRAISFKDSMKTVLQGVAFGIFTPYRMGEWFGRVLTFENKRKTGMLMGMIGSIMQLMVIGMIGVIFLVPLLFHADIAGGFDFDLKTGLLLIAFLIMGILTIKFLLKYKHNSRFHQCWSIVAGQSKQWYVKTFGYTWLRYMVFSLQLAILLVLLTDIPFYDIVVTVPVYFFVITFLPSFSIVDLGIRISSGLLLFSNGQAYVLEISTAVAVIWFLNVFIPAAIGSLLVVNRFNRSFTEICMPALRKYQINFSFGRFYKPMKHV